MQIWQPISELGTDFDDLIFITIHDNLQKFVRQSCVNCIVTI